MRGLVYGLAYLVVAVAPPAAVAQVPGSGAPLTPAQAAGGPIGRLSTDQYRARIEAEEMRRRTGSDTLTEAEAASAEEEYGADRVALANQVQVLINEGKCADARNLANQNGERAMALHVRRTCR